MSKFFVKQCSATISTLTSAAQLYTSTGAQVQIWHWQALQTTGESQEMLPVHGCTLLNAAKSWGKYLYSSCLCSQEMCPLHLAECMTFPAWCPGQQLWQGEQWRTTAMDSRDHHPPGNCSGVIQTERERPPKMPSSNLQGRQLRFSQICIVLDLPQWLTMNSVSCSEKRKQHLLFAWPWKAEEVADYLFNPKTWELTDHCHFPKSFSFYFPPQSVWVLFALQFFTDSLLPAWDICDLPGHGCQLKRGSL